MISRPARPITALVALAASLASSSVSFAEELVWTEILHFQDGRFNRMPRLADPRDSTLNVCYRAQIGTDGNTQQIAAGVLTSGSFDDVTSNASSKESPDVAESADGVTHVVWREDLGGGDWQVLYANDRGGSWLAPRQLTFDAMVKGSPRIAADPGLDTTFVHVAYSTAEPGSADDEIYYLRYDPLADASEVVQVTNDAVTDDDVSIGFGGDDVVRLAWISGGAEGAVRYAEGDTGGFAEVSTGIAAGAAEVDLAVDLDDNAHLAYRHSVSASVKVIRYIQRDGAGFTAPLDVSPADALYSEPSVAATGGLAIAFVSNTAGKKGLYVATMDDGLPAFAPPDTVHADETLTYNETDLLTMLQTGLPGRGASAPRTFVVTSTGYVEADTVRADLRAFFGAVPDPPHGTDAPVLPAAGAALAASPNPFKDGMTIAFTLRDPASRVHLEVLDVAGRRVARLLAAPRSAGTHSVLWRPESVAAGVYFVRLESDGAVETRRVQRIR